MKSVARLLAYAAAAMLVNGPAFGLELDGVITIEFGADDRVRYTPGALAYQKDTIANLRDSTRSPKDDGRLFNEGRVILFGQFGGTSVGFNDGKDWVGVFLKKKGVDVGRVGPGHSLILSLGPHVDGEGLAVVGTTLGLTFKQNATVNILAENAGEIIAEVTIRSGNAVVSNVGHPPPDVTNTASWNIDGANALIHNCNEGPDSQPDSGTMCMRELFGIPGWTTLTMTTINDGTWSLGSGTSTLQLANIDGLLDCQQTTITASDPNSGAVGFLHRRENTNGGQCTPIPYSLSLDDQQLVFLADYLGQLAAFDTHVEWEPITVSALRPSLPVVREADDGIDDDGEPPDDTQAQTTFARLPLSFQQFLPTDPEYYFDVCVGTPNYEDFPDGDTTEDPNDEIPLGGLIELVPPTDGFPDMSALDGTQYGCLLKRIVKYIETDPEPDDGDGDMDQPDTVRIIEDGYVQGDWRLSRGN
ncbi:MAG: hypothetical protein O7C67_06385 [Gammaproteobacteria bacterium]|nr:hypothetical protein [Gammaproteobacteria bacterium]